MDHAHILVDQSGERTEYDWDEVGRSKAQAGYVKYDTTGWGFFEFALVFARATPARKNEGPLARVFDGATASRRLQRPS